MFPYLALQYLLYRTSEKDLSREHAFLLLGLFSAGLVLLYPRKILAALQYAAYLLWVFTYAVKKTGDVLFSYTFSMLSVHFGGWLYELPYWHDVDMFYNPSYPFFFNSQMLSGAFMVILLIRQKFRVNKPVILGLLVFTVYEVLFTFRVTYYRFMWFDAYLFSRVGMMFLMFSIVKGVKKIECD